MRISKTLFKNLMRCPNFASILDMYRNRAANNVQIIKGFSQEELDKGLSLISDDIFTEQNEELMEIFSELFDEQTGEDLTNVTSAQLEAFAETFVEVERLAMEQAKEIFQHDLIASTNTYQQKMFSFEKSGHEFYCYLDGYMEEEKVIRVFEVKATTSRKYDDYHLKFRKTKTSSGADLPFFILGNDGVMKYVANEYLNADFASTISQPLNKIVEEVEKKKRQLLTPYSDVGKYIYDLAIERFMIEESLKNQNQANIPQIYYYLVVLNCEYIYDGYEEQGKKVYRKDENNHQLFKFFDMTYLTSLLQNDIRDKQVKIFKYLDELTLSKNRLGEYCEYKKTTQCKFNKVCFSNVLKDGSILEFLMKQYAFKSKEVDSKGKRQCLTLYEMINNGCCMIDDCRDYIERLDNLIQYDCYVNNLEYSDKERIFKALEAIQYPIYHLDFESYNSPLPRYRGEKPYMQSLFQYSLHVEKEPGQCDIVDNHFEYLALDHQDHREDLIKSLIKNIDLSNGGSVMVYNQNFEKTRLSELARIFPKYQKELNNINEHIYDLLFVLKGNKNFYEQILNTEEIERLSEKPSFAFYNNKLHGSFSIKKVLPIFTDLTYKTLEVKNGTEAILTYGLLPHLTKEEYEKKYLALKIYCRQDTWAMVEILRGLRKLFTV